MRGDQPIHLTTRERELLRLLAGGAVVSRRTLAPRAGVDAEASERSVDVEIARLRRKIDGGAHCLQTVRGQGYRLIVDGEGTTRSNTSAAMSMDFSMRSPRCAACGAASPAGCMSACPRGSMPRAADPDLPIVLLQSAVAYVYMERHWEAITDRLSPPWRATWRRSRMCTPVSRRIPGTTFSRASPAWISICRSRCSANRPCRRRLQSRFSRCSTTRSPANSRAT